MFGQGFLIVLFAGAAVSKVGDLERFAAAIAQIPAAGPRRSGRIAAAVIAWEVLVALVVLLDAQAGAVAAIATLVAFTAIVLYQSRGDRKFDCGCFGGPVPSVTDERMLVVRNGIALAAAASLLVAAQQASLAAAATGVALALVVILVESAWPLLRAMRRQEATT